MGKYLETGHPGIFKYVGKKGAVYGIDYYDADGKRIKKVTGSLLGDAQEQLADIKKMKRKGTYRAFVQARKKTFNDLLEEYIKKIQDQKFYQNSMRYFIPVLKEKFSDQLLSDIGYKELEDFRDERKRVPTQYGRPRSKRTLNIEMTVLRKMFKKAFQWDWIEKNPFDRGDDLFFKNTGKRERALTPIEARQLIDASSGKLKPIILVGLFTGLRKNDIFNLKWKDIDFDKARIILKEEKTEKTRIIHMNQDLVTLLQNLPVKEEYIFPGRKGKPLTNVDRSFAKAIKESGVDPGKGSQKIVFHTLRHSCISQLIERGADSMMVKNYVNHASIQTTEGYAHLSEEYQKHTARLLDGLYDVQGFIGKKMGRSEENQNISA